MNQTSEGISGGYSVRSMRLFAVTLPSQRPVLNECAPFCDYFVYHRELCGLVFMASKQWPVRSLNL